MSISSWNGHASVELPRTFNGPIYTKSDFWGTRFSPAIEEYVTPFSMERRNGRYFIGSTAHWRTSRLPLVRPLIAERS